MQLTSLERLCGSPYISRGNLKEQFKMSLRAIDTRIQEIKEEIKQGRYGEFAYIKDGGFVLLNYLVWIDYLKYRERLKEKNLRKNVPPFDAKKIAQEIGWYGKCA